MLKESLSKRSCHSLSVYDLLLVCHHGLLSLEIPLIYYPDDTLMHKLAIGGESPTGTIQGEKNVAQNSVNIICI